MKKIQLVTVVTGIAAACTVGITGFSIYRNSQSLYRPSKEPVVAGEAQRERQGIDGAMQWWFNNQKDPATNELNVQEMMSVRASFSQSNSAARTNSATNTASLSFNEIGPDNVGGRTRAILIDKDNNQHMFAGGVSGGLFESTDGGSTWTKSSFNNSGSAFLTVTTLCQDPSSGAMYCGTGEMYLYGTGVSNGIGAGGFFGGGVWKSTDHGANWTQLPSTDPTLYNSASTWCAVNKMACNASGRVFAATNKGLEMSDDGGNTWTVCVTLSNGNPNTANVFDVDINGSEVVCSISGKPYISYTNGDVGSFTVYGGGTGAGYGTGTLGRTEFAIAPQDANYIYAFVSAASGATKGVYVSVDGGQTWTIVAAGGNVNFEPFGTGQGNYDNTCAVDPSDKNRCFFGGVELWKFEMINNNPPAGQWTRVAVEFASALNPFYVHSDKHIILFHPSNPNTFFVGTDGGIFKSTNLGQTYIACNKGYNVTQCYSVADDPYSSSHSLAFAGCQDNGTQFVNGSGNTAMSADAIGGGDGGDVEMSFINPNALFTTVYYGALNRSNNYGVSSGDFYNPRIANLPDFEAAGFANFVTPIRLWESKDDANSHDSVRFINSKITQAVENTNGDSTHYSGTINPPQNSSSIVLSTVMFITTAGDTLFSNGSGTITGAAGSGTINAAGVYDLNYTTPPNSGGAIDAVYSVMFPAAAVVSVNSKIPNQTYAYVTPSTINPDDTVMIQDPIQSRLAVGLLAGDNPFTSATTVIKGGVFITKQALDFSKTPDWIKVAGANSKPDAYSGTAQTLCWSADGKNLYVGNDNGHIYRISNLDLAIDSATADVDSASGVNTSTPVTCTHIGFFSGYAITGIDADPNNDRILVSLGNYGQTNHVYLCNNASTVPNSATTGNFANRSGNLATTTTPYNYKFPVYAVSFDKYTPNRVLIGTEFGVWETTNINAASPTWADVTDYNSMGRVPVLQIRQQRHEPWYVQNSGIFYYGTHGRGMWRSEESWQVPNGINEPQGGTNGVTVVDIKIYPNPTSDFANLGFRLGQAGNVTVQVFDLTGKLVLSQKDNYAAGDNNARLNIAALNEGTYIVALSNEHGKLGTGRFMVMH